MIPVHVMQKTRRDGRPAHIRDDALAMVHLELRRRVQRAAQLDLIRPLAA